MLVESRFDSVPDTLGGLFFNGAFRDFVPAWCGTALPDPVVALGSNTQHTVLSARQATHGAARRGRYVKVGATLMQSMLIMAATATVMPFIGALLSAFSRFSARRNAITQLQLDEVRRATAGCAPTPSLAHPGLPRSPGLCRLTYSIFGHMAYDVQHRDWQAYIGQKLELSTEVGEMLNLMSVVMLFAAGSCTRLRASHSGLSHHAPLPSGLTHL